MKRTFLISMAASLGVLLAGPALAADQDRAQTKQQIRDQQIYGYQLMTPAERDAHRIKMRAAKNAEERERIRAEHHAEMQIRAKEKGMTLPDMPPAGRGPGTGGGGGRR